MRNVAFSALVGVIGFACFFYSPRVIGQSPEDDKSIRMVVEGYLKAKDWKERLAFVHDAPKQEDAMKAKYEGAVFQLQNQSVQKIEEIEKRPKHYLVKATWTEKLKAQRFAGYYVVQKTADGFKMDWPASVGYNPTNLKTLVSKKPKDAHSLRLIAVSNSTFEGDYAKAKDTYYCFLLKEDNPLQTVYGYIPKTNPDGQRLIDLLKSRKETKDRVIVEIRFVAPNGDEVKNPRTVAITKLVSESWILAP
jgi:gamma-glutamylcyclotransferase (GGCT)/AIG2-like uncharacterized protein YtfP